MPATIGRTRLLEHAWIGDAVLSLYARGKILREDSQLDAAKFDRMTSNHFLSTIGEPAAVEAEIGLAYARGGLPEAFAWIEEKLIPVFQRQEANRLKGR